MGLSMRSIIFWGVWFTFNFLGGCKNRTSEDDISDLAAAAGCQEMDPVSSESLTGADIFELTSRCVFDRDVHSLRIRILGETFQKVLDDGCADRDSGYGHVSELVLDGIRIQDVGIKVRGNTSRCNEKRQFKFKFDVKEAFSVWRGRTETKVFPENDGRTVFGLEGISIRSSSNDPSMIRERVSSRVFTEAENLKRTAIRGGLVYRVAFTKFLVSFGRTQDEGPEGTFTRLVDGHYYDYKGFYSLAENIDKTFLRSRFQIEGDKLKGFHLFQADKGQASFERDKYTRKGWVPEYIDGKKADDPVAAEAKLFNLFDVLDGNASDATLQKEIDVDNIVNYTAAAMIAGHWDSLLANRNNDFLFFNGDTKQWQLLAWDLDNTQGALHDQYHALMTDDIFDPARVRKEKLFTTLFSASRPAFREKLKERLRQYLSGFFSAERFDAMIDSLDATVRHSIEGWEGFSPQSFKDIKNFGKSRRSNLASQL